jgi:predicted metalloendopeptidase
MGYRSDFKFIAQGSKEKIQELVNYLKAFAAIPIYLNDWVDPHYGQAAWALEFLDKHEVVDITPVEDGLAVFLLTVEDSKCYGEFESLVSDMHTHAREVLELDTSSARLGEDYNDLEVIHGDNVSIGVVRRLGDFDY